MAGIRTPDLQEKTTLDDFIGNKDSGAGSETVRVSASAAAAQLRTLIQFDSAVVAVVTKTLSTPPGSPTLGDRYIVKATGTGAWAGHDNAVATAINGGWDFVAPTSGYRAFLIDEKADYFWDATASKWTVIDAAAFLFATEAERDAVTGAPANLEAHVISDVVGHTASRARASNVATIVTTAAHGLTSGKKVNVRGLGGSGYNANQVTVTVTNTTTFTYPNTGANESTTADTAGQVDRNGASASDGAGAWVWKGDIDVTLVKAQIVSLQTKVDTEMAPLDSPALTGNSIAETPPIDDVSTRIATTEFVAAVAEAITTGALEPMQAIIDQLVGLSLPGYDVILVAGQSNAVGYGMPQSFPTDNGASGRVYQYCGYGPNIDTVQPGNEPLQHPGSVIDNSTSIGFAVAFANALVADLGSSRKILLVPAAYGGTGFLDNYWQPGQTGFNFAVAQANEAMALSVAGDGVNRFMGILWHQGERDGDLRATPGEYTRYLDAMIAAFRAQITGAAKSWFILGQLVPGYMATKPFYQAIDVIHQNTPKRFAKCAFWAGDTGSGALLHYNAASQRANGAAAHAAIADLSNAPVLPAAVQSLTVTMRSTTARLSWSLSTAGALPYDYLVEYSIHGSGVWTTAPHGSYLWNPTTVISGLTPSTSYDFRVTPISTPGNGPASVVTASTTAADVGSAWNPSTKASNITLADNDRVATAPAGSGYLTVVGTTSHAAGKYYFEALVENESTNNTINFVAGIVTGAPTNYNTNVGSATLGASGYGVRSGIIPGATAFASGITIPGGAIAYAQYGTPGTVVQICVDFDSGKIFTGANGLGWGNGDPVAGTSPSATFSPGTSLYVAGSIFAPSSTRRLRLLTGADVFFTPPSGYSAW